MPITDSAPSPVTKILTIGSAKTYARMARTTSAAAMTPELRKTDWRARSNFDAPTFCPTAVAVPCASPMAGRNTSELSRFPIPKAATAFGPSV